MLLITKSERNAGIGIDEHADLVES